VVGLQVALPLGLLTSFLGLAGPSAAPLPATPLLHPSAAAASPILPQPPSLPGSAPGTPPCLPLRRERWAAPATLITPTPAQRSPLLSAPPMQATLPGYAAALRTTTLGWPRLDRWCLWVEPLSDPGDPFQRRWLQAVEMALAAWGELLPLQRVSDPAAAQLWIRRRRPPLATGPDGRQRASHGRALLRLREVEREPGLWRLEPAVELLIGPGQRAEALQATAVHELGHGFGLWGHSSDPADALAVSAGPRPVLRPSSADRATLQWLQAQPTAFGAPVAGP
jgi:hypothetical protein